MKQPATDPFQAIADVNRRMILNMLSKKSLPINSLAENFDMSRPAVSKHIKVLYGAGFISIEVKGRERYCKLKHDGFNAVQEWMDHYDQFWDQKLDALGKFLSQNKIKAKNYKTVKKK